MPLNKEIKKLKNPKKKTGDLQLDDGVGVRANFQGR